MSIQRKPNQLIAIINPLAKSATSLPTLLVVGLLTAAQAATLAWDANGTTVAQTDGAAAWLAADLWWTGSANTT